MRLKSGFLAPYFLLMSLVLALSGCASPQGMGDYLGLSPHWNWKTLETEHFRLSFPENLADVSRQAASHLEDAQRILGPILRWTPRHKVEILVIDNEDATNGLTAAVARMGIALIVKPPENWYSIYYYDDWLRMLAFHEYTHYLNMDATSEYSDTLRTLFGDVALPNAAWPTWMLEGLAVYIETRHTHGGRGRSPFYEMILRTAVEEGVLDTPAFITLDRINGQNPYYPSGETPYLFGYELMNRIASEPFRDEPRGDSALGWMSYQSSGRLPYFINGNLKNLTGKDWYGYWKEWIDDTRLRANKQLAHIRTKPVTQVRRLTEKGQTTLGMAFSPDGKWLAYTQELEDISMSLFLKNLATGQTERITRKTQGATLAFTPDSKVLIFSSLQRSDNYNMPSELSAYDLERKHTIILTDHARASDPDVSPDGKSVVFVQTDHATEYLALAELKRNDRGTIELGKPRRIYSPSIYDGVATPKFVSTDGNQIVFSRHKNGQASEELMQLDVASNQAREIVSNGAFNRFPTFTHNQKLLYVSDVSGVDNVYQLNSRGNPQSQAITNLTSGVMLPAQDTHDKLYGVIFSTRGWNLAELLTPASPATTPATSSAPKIDGPAAPPFNSASATQADAAKSAVIQDYSAWPSLWPRQWTPIFLLNPSSLYLGAQVAGFDAIDRHRYFLAAALDTATHFVDVTALYANRTLGPTLTFSGQSVTTAAGYTSPTSTVLSVIRKNQVYLSAMQPILSTYSVLTPGVAINGTQLTQVTPGANPSNGDITAWGSFTPSLDTTLTLTDADSSSLAISAEEGYSLQLGMRTYFGLDVPVYKGFALARTFVPLGQHNVLVPVLKAQAVSQLSAVSALAAVNTQGRYAASVLQTFPLDSLDQLAIRGYPNKIFLSKASGAASLDWRFPLAHIFRGWGTQPVFLDDLFGFAFAETTFFPGQDFGYTVLPAAGAGLRLSTEFLIHIPLVFSLEYHQGFQTAAGGVGELFFQAGLANFGF